MSLGLYHLLTPYFLAGFTFPDEVDAYLSTLGVADLTAIHDDAAAVYTGTLTWGDAPKRQRSSSGGGFAWEDITVRFRLVVPRDGANFINTAAHALPAQQLADLLDRFFPVDQTGSTFTEYPGVRFRLELLLDELHFELGENWKPGKLDADHRVVRDQSIAGPVRIVLPKVALSYEQTDDFQSPPTLRLLSWGSGGFGAPSTLSAGELGRMEPPIAAHSSGRLGFGFGEVVIDGDPDNTPPEILKFFGTDESFTGIYVRSARLYWADEGKDFAINCAINDLLISFAGEVSFDTSVDFIGPETTLSAALKLVDAGKDVPVSRGSKAPQSTVVTGGKVRASTAATGGVEVTGGVPPLSISLKAGTTELYDSATGRVSLAALTPGEHTLALRVRDGATGAAQQSYDEDIVLTLLPAPTTTATPAGAPADRPAQPGDLPAITTANPVGDATHAITHAGTVSGTRERFRVTGVGTPTVSAGTSVVSVTNGFFEVDIPENTNGRTLTASWPAITSARQEFRLGFTKSWPRSQDWPNVLGQYTADTVADQLYRGTGTAALREWLGRLASGGTVPNVEIDAHASFEDESLNESDFALTERRRDVAVAAVGTFGSVTRADPHGNTAAPRPPAPRSRQQDRVAIVSATTSQPAATASLSVSRGQRPSTGTPVEREPTPPPAPVPNKPPGIFRRIGIRVKVIRNEPVLVELTGQLDFETGLEASLRNPSGATPLPPGGSLELKQKPAAVAGPNRNPKDGVVDFRLTVVHDSATHSWTETLAIGAHPDDVDGLLQLTNPHSGALTPANRLKDMLGSVLILAPIIGTAAGAADPKSAGSYAVLGGVIVGAAALGAAGFLRTEKITLYGGELRLRQYIPPNDPAVFTDAGVVFDYAVEFGVDISQLGIATTKPLKVRYRALGFNLNFPNGQYQPIFDTSKGYELDLSDPGLFKLPSPIDNVLKIFGARIAKVNPLTVELDLGMKVDLGVVKIDRFKVKIPVDPLGVPTILPSGISLNISQVLVGSGFVNIIEPPAAPPGEEQPGFGGIEGAFDVTLVPIKLRIAASFGVRPVSKDGRKATAVFLGLIIDLPSPILLGNSGVAIYGFSGLFAMHYKRLEFDPDPTDATGPAILWLKRAGGEPAKLFNNGERLWDTELDRWSFGIGIMLGTSEGGFLVNLRGMFVLELPGPRILIFVKIMIVAVLQDLKPATDLTIGILGVIDLDFARMSFTVGVIVDLEIKEIVAVVIPVELYTKLNDFTQWHLYIGTFNAPASAMIFNIVRGFGYVMISGPDIDNWPGYGELRTLPGIAMAAGVGASIVFGDEGLGLFLKVCARADVAISFSPRLFLIGRVQLDGELRLFVVSVGAHGRLEVEAPDPSTHLHGEICGHVDLVFFKVEGCVTVDIGRTPPPPPPPALIRNVWLQSHAPVITAGQGGDRPIDASLGDAVQPGQTAPVVPIDTVPVIQFQTAPTVGSLTTFTAPIGTAPGTRPGGWVSLGGSRRVTYSLTALRLAGGPLPGPGTPPAAWRPDPTVSPAGGRTNIDLALLSNVPMMGARAMERSADLTGIIEGTWGDVCTPVAPPAAVLWTFCRQPLGPSGHGWTLTGHAWPDPAGTSRSAPVDVVLRVDEPEPDAASLVLDGILGHTSAGRIDPARVIGPNGPPAVDPPDPGKQECVDIGKEVKDGDPNPSQVLKLFRVTVFDPRGVPFSALRFSGVGAARGLDVGWRTELALTRAAAEVTVTLVTFARAATVAAFDAAGALVDQRVTSGAQRTPEALVLSGKGIVRVVVDAPQDETVLLRVCVRAQAQRVPRPIAAAPDLACMRALQLPEQRLPGGKGDVALTPELTKAAQNRPDDRWVDLRTGPLTFARLFLAVAKALYDKDMVVVEQLDNGGGVLRTDPLSALHPSSTLPGTWTDPAGPWVSEVDPVSALLADPDLVKLVRVVVEFEPLPDTVRLRIRVRGRARVPEHPAVLLAVAELVTGGEWDRAGTDEASRSGQVDTLAGYLGGTSQVPLLTPGRNYTLEVDYVPTTEDTDPKGAVTTTVHPAQTERFAFTTDSDPPKRLDAYVLATSPRHEERFVFADETVELVFNDLQVVQLYAAYGKQLRAVLRPADGTAVPAHQVGSLDQVPARYTAPLMDSLDAMAKAGKLPCVGPYHLEGHGKFTFPEPLRPSMAYTLDIETVPATNPPPGKPIVPLFRRQFTTGRFTSLAALAHDLKANPVRHTIISAALTGLPGPVATDLAIEQALAAAGLPVPGAPAEGGRIVLWRPVGSGHHVPHAVLIDASEPLWRLRDVPKQEPVDGSTDPSFQRVVPGEESALELRGTAPVTRFVRSPSGTRTLVFLNDAAWPAAGGTVVIDAVRPASTLYGTAEQRVNVSTLRLGGGAPWEDDNA